MKNQTYFWAHALVLLVIVLIAALSLFFQNYSFGDTLSIRLMASFLVLIITFILIQKTLANEEDIEGKLAKYCLPFHLVAIIYIIICVILPSFGVTY